MSALFSFAFIDVIILIYTVVYTADRVNNKKYNLLLNYIILYWQAQL